MKLKKIVKFITLVMVMIGTLVAGCSLVQANTTPDRGNHDLNFKIWKTNNQTGSDSVIENDGNSIGIGNYPSGITAYDATKYGNVTYTVYDITDLMDSRGVGLDDYNTTKYTTVRDELIQEILNGKTDPQEVLEAQNDFVSANLGGVEKASAVVDQKNGQTEAFGKFLEKGYYLIMETSIDNINNFTKISAPLIVPSSQLAEGNNGTIHLYPKNVVKPSTTDFKFTKNGEDPDDVELKTALPGVTFTLETNGKDPQTITTDADGELDLQNLTPNVTYTLTETETVAGYKLPSNDVSLTFQVSDEGIIRVIGNYNHEYFDIASDGKSADINNYLTTGGVNFVKVDSSNKSPLGDAEFKLSKVSGEETMWAEFDNNQKFEAWKTNKDDGTPLVSNADGQFGFTGVPYAADGNNVEYQLVETQAPDGYMLLSDPISIEINDKSGSAVAKEIENSKTSLPMTGGMGIWLFVIAGLVLMGGSGYLYYKKQRS